MNSTTERENHYEYDYVIVGGGSAGCVLANRLSENPDVTVALVEAGPESNHLAISTPAYMWMLMKMKSINWSYNTRSEPNLNRRSLFWPRGKMMGGCSSSNAMVYTRGHPSDYDHWQSLGNIGWSFQDMLPYFKKSENQENHHNEFHGRGGLLNVMNLKQYKKINEAFYSAGQACGYEFNADFNGAQQEGVGPYQVTQKNGRRWSTYEAYVKPIKQRQNLTILSNATVTKIEVNEGAAQGVSYIRRSKWCRSSRGFLTAKREVILSGGAINSPQLLKLSGIGPADELKQHNIPVVVDLPGVGENLQDHLDITLVDKCKKWATHGIHVDQVVTTFTDLFQYYVRGTGRLASNGTESGGFIKSSPEEPIPDLQLHFTAIELRNHGRDITALLGHAYSLHVCHLRPKSRGRVCLKSADPMEKADIYANYLSHPDDIKKLVQGARAAIEILNAHAFEPYRDKALTQHDKLISDTDIEHFIRQRAESIYHPVGTCKMGIDEWAVVDDQLKVKGVRQLRVVDASIMPTIVGSNTNAPTIAIAEKAAEMILYDQDSQRENNAA